MDLGKITLGGKKNPIKVSFIQCDAIFINFRNKQSLTILHLELYTYGVEQFLKARGNKTLVLASAYLERSEETHD